MVSVRIPARAAAGRYVIPIDARAGSVAPMRDSIVILVSPRRAVTLMLTEQPSYAISNTAWRAGFLLRNDGNVPARIALRATSARGTGVTIETPTVSLAPSEARTVYARSSTALASQQSHDDVLELFAADVADTLVTASASARVTIVQRAGRPEARHTVGSSLRVRAAQRGVGVSPFELTGGGKLRAGGEEVVDFTIRGPAGPLSPFGDRDQYSLTVRAPTYTVRLGDAVYGSSPLLSSGQTGVGAGGELTRGSLTFGGHVNRARYQFTDATEQAAFVGVRPSGIAGAPQLTFTAMNRSGGYLDGRILGSALSLSPRGTMRVEAELAGSDGPSGRGVGRSLHVSGGDRVTYDVSHVAAGDAFVGVTRGSQHDYGALSARLTDDVQLSASASAHESHGTFLERRLGQSLRTSSVELAFRGRASLRYSSLDRSTQLLHSGANVAQRSVGGRIEHGFGPVNLWSSADVGTSRSDVDLTTHPYRALSYGMSAVVGAQHVSLFSESHRGSEVTLGARRYQSYGGDATVRIGAATTLAANALRTRLPDLPEGEFSQLDVRASRMLRHGSSATLRARFMSGLGAMLYGKRLVFLEYAIPLQLPTDELPVAGRVRGQVVNESGQGVAGALVRIGPQAAITDAAGRVSFAGVPAGQHRISLAQRATSLETAFSGVATVQVDSGRADPAAFHLAVERAGSISGSVRAMRTARTGIGAAPDSLADDGPLGGVLVVLAGVRDTLYRATDAQGMVEFTHVASGRWSMRVHESAPEQSRWQPQSIEVELTPGERERVEFVRVTRRREVRLLDGDPSTVPVETVPNEDRRQQR